jgi:hypothetical protein
MMKKLDDWINSHKFEIVLVTITAVSLIALRQQSKQQVNVVPLSSLDSIPFGYVRLG